MDFGNKNDESLEEKVCIHKLIAESQRQGELEDCCKYRRKILPNLKIIRVPIGCIGYFQKGCYSCSGKNEKKGCFEYFIF
jgi:hypothetical protein